MVISVSDLVVVSFTLVGDAFIISDSVPSPIVSSFNSVITLLTPANNIFRINPISTSNFKMSVAFVQPNGGEGLFNTSGGVTGAFTAVADAGLGFLTLTDAGTTLSNGDTINILTDNALAYDGGYVVSNVQANSFDVQGFFEGTASGTWDTSPLDQTSINILSTDSPPFPQSTVSGEVTASGNILETDIPEVGARVIVNSTAWGIDSQERIKQDSEGGAIYSGLDPVTIKSDGNIYMRPINATKDVSCQFVRQDAERVQCTFNTGNNSITTISPHGFSIDDNLTLRDSGGVIDTALRDDIVYYVNSIVSATEFTVKYSVGGGVISLSGGSSGDTSFALADFHGSRPIEPTASGRARTLVPQSIYRVSQGDITLVVITNETDAVNLNVIDTYYRNAR